MDPDPVGDEDGWVDGYRGLWGLDTGDRFAGERAPAGPKYTRTGSVRQAWYDPLGFAGLEKVAPPSTRVGVLEARIVALTAERDAAIVEAEGLAGGVPALEQEVAASNVRPRAYSPHPAPPNSPPTRPASASSACRPSRRPGRSMPPGAASASSRRAGWRTREPTFATPPNPSRRSLSKRRAYGETWAALSVGLLIAALALIVWFRILPPFLAIVVLVGAYLAIEAFFSRRVQGMVLRISMALAIVTAIVLAVVFIRELVLAGLLALGILLISDNIAEIRRHRSR